MTEQSVVHLSVRPINLSAVDPATWDRDGSRSGATMLSAHAHLSRLSLWYLFRRRARTYVVLLDDGAGPSRIGHFTALVRGASRVFYDGLNLLPPYQHLWPDAMAAALRELGPGNYQYGTEWTTEPSRAEELGAIPGVSLVAVEDFYLQGVDFARWPSWDAYYKSLNKNKRRDARNAERRFAQMSLECRPWGQAIGLLIPFVRLRWQVFARKNLPFRPMKELMRCVWQMVCFPTQFELAYISADQQICAVATLCYFESNTYYVDAAALPKNGGASWRLMLTLLERAYARAPAGKFILGSYHERTRDHPAGLGLLRARASLRASDWKSSFVNFNWQP